MKLDAAKILIVQAWNTAWTALYGSPPSIDYVLDNEQAAEPNPEVSWVRFSIRHFAGEIMSQGDPARFRRRGNLIVQVFSPIDKGTNDQDVLVKNVIDSIEKKLWGSVPTDPVATLGATPQEQPADGQWSVVKITCPFEYWETK